MEAILLVNGVELVNQCVTLPAQKAMRAESEIQSSYSKMLNIDVKKNIYREGESTRNLRSRMQRKLCHHRGSRNAILNNLDHFSSTHQTLSTTVEPTQKPMASSNINSTVAPGSIETESTKRTC